MQALTIHEVTSSSSWAPNPSSFDRAFSGLSALAFSTGASKKNETSMSCLESFHEGIELGMSCWNLGLDSWVIKFGPISKFARNPYLVGG